MDSGGKRMRLFDALVLPLIKDAILRLIVLPK